MMNFLDDHIIVINVVNISQSSKKILKYFTLYVLLVICEIKVLLTKLLTKIKVFGKYLKPDLPFSRNVDFASKGKLC